MPNEPYNITHPIRILLWSFNGIIPQKYELQAFLLNNPVSILLISKSHLTTHLSCKIPDYLTYKCDHPDGIAHAGSAILIKSNIKHTILPSY